MPVCDEAPPVKIDLSWSKLKTYEACRQRTRLLMQKKRSPIVDGRNFLPGTLADRCMRRWLEEGTFEPGGMHKFLDEEWATHTGKDSEYKIKWRNNPAKDQQYVIDTVRRGLDNLEPILLDKVEPALAYIPEFRFKSIVAIPDLWGGKTEISIMGAVDVAVLLSKNEDDSGNYGLYDLKITENDDYIRSTLAQLTFYDLAFQGWTGVQPVEHAFWTPLLQEKVISVDVTRQERIQMWSRIINYCHNVWAGNWQLTSDKNECYNCPVKHACPRFHQPTTKDDQGRNRVSFERPKFEVMGEDDSV